MTTNAQSEQPPWPPESFPTLDGKGRPDNGVEPLRGKGPNVLLIMSDQHRADWLGCAGADWLKTPNIDALAARGLRFTRCASNSPLCAPSRAALAAGLRSGRARVLGNNHLFPYREVPTYYQALRGAGHRVGCVGKTDLHKRDHSQGPNGDPPLMYHLGFTDPHETEGKESGAFFGKGPRCPYQRFLVERGLHELYAGDNLRRREPKGAFPSPLPLTAYHDYYIGERACEFLGSVPDEDPFHYFVSFVGPHNPWDAPEEYAARYKAADMPVERVIHDPMEGRTPAQRAHAKRFHADLDPAETAEIMRQYAGMISLVDDFVGRFVDILRRRGLLDNTVILYTSDHGEMMGDHGLFYKSQYYEASLRVPLIATGPGIEARGECDALVHLFDVAPTSLELAEADPLGPMEARSLMPILRGEATAGRDWQISELPTSRMLFDGRWKFVEWDDEGVELFDLEEDPTELTNRAASDPKRANAMRTRLRRLLLQGDAFVE